MRIVVAGGTGFLGAPLTTALAADGHEVVVLSRRADAPRSIQWRPDGTVGPWSRALDGAAAVVNLAGESIAGSRWSAAHKARILDSRVQATRSLVAAIKAAAAPPAVLVSGSAVGYYGPRGSDVVSEATPPGHDFLADVCVKWEHEAAAAASAQTRVVCIRTGLVLERDGGALPQMLPPFRFGVGGPVGSGQQYWPWIHRADWIGLVRWAIESGTLTDPVNATAPEPVTSREFARTLGRVMHRPAFMPAPAFALRLMLGEMADALLLTGQRAVPEKAVNAGFSFKYPALDAALLAIFSAP